MSHGNPVLQPLGCKHVQLRTCALLRTHGISRPLRGALGAAMTQPNSPKRGPEYAQLKWCWIRRSVIVC